VYMGVYGCIWHVVLLSVLSVLSLATDSASAQ
jgi:hypothetical protein